MILVQLLTALLRLLLFLGSILQEMSRLALSRRSPAGNGTVLSWLLWVWSGTFCWVHFLTWSEDQERTVKRTGLVLQQSWSSCALTSWLEFMNFSGPELVEVMQTEAQIWMGLRCCCNAATLLTGQIAGECKPKLQCLCVRARTIGLVWRGFLIVFVFDFRNLSKKYQPKKNSKEEEEYRWVHEVLLGERAW